ncbi:MULTISPECIES: flagellar basal body L-ring protein FlgH [Aureimonas]|uniref:flagellar basal body L-ring protein FlgH n=1 Tax=Aureimonas TaxID=414371 RepID=UPI000ABFF16F|nr:MULTISPECIES: flagellar basal body L-ring protein FlgH [Aureimonas]
MRILACLLATGVLAGCTTTREDLMKEPVLTPVGTGLHQFPPVVQPQAAYSPEPPRHVNSLWTGRNADFFRDTRALNVGDIVTVKIKIDDKAKLDNNTKRSRDSGVSVGADLKGSFGSWGLPTVGADLGLKNGTKTAGKGTVDRQEEINVSVAAVVTQVLPNGNLYIAGQQEIRVNFEVRVLSIAGIIRPGDILPNNTISYEKIAEARISYGGRGRLTEVQQPAWGQQVLDNALPY